MYSISDLKKETLIEVDEIPYKIVEAKHISLGRGGAVLRTKLKNLLNGNMLDKTFRPAEKITPAEIEHVTSQYLYRQNDKVVFMDVTTFDQMSVEEKIIGNALAYIPEGGNCAILKFKDKIIDIDLPNWVFLKVIQTEPGIKGDTVSASVKSCMLETGLKLNVPLFINVGDVVKVDTRTGQYLERQK